MAGGIREGGTFAFENLHRFSSTKPEACGEHITSYSLQHSFVLFCFANTALELLLGSRSRAELCYYMLRLHDQ